MQMVIIQNIKTQVNTNFVHGCIKSKKKTNYEHGCIVATSICSYALFACGEMYVRCFLFLFATIIYNIQNKYRKTKSKSKINSSKKIVVQSVILRGSTVILKCCARMF
jgi:hypothetical protein